MRSIICKDHQININKQNQQNQIVSDLNILSHALTWLSLFVYHYR